MKSHINLWHYVFHIARANARFLHLHVFSSIHYTFHYYKYFSSQPSSIIIISFPGPSLFFKCKWLSILFLTQVLYLIHARLHMCYPLATFAQQYFRVLLPSDFILCFINFLSSSLFWTISILVTNPKATYSLKLLVFLFVLTSISLAVDYLPVAFLPFLSFYIFDLLNFSHSFLVSLPSNQSSMYLFCSMEEEWHCKKPFFLCIICTLLFWISWNTASIIHSSIKGFF